MKPFLWIFPFAWGCHHGQLNRPSTIEKRRYQACWAWGQEREGFVGCDALSKVKRR
jgi:hypothetical protein